MKVPFSFLTEQFGAPEPIFNRMREFLKRCDFTLGEDLTEFENRYAQYTGIKHAVGVGSGTDALCLSLKVAGVKPGDEVITPTHTFVATVGAIVQAGATPVFVDVGADHLIDCDQIESAITDKTTAIVPVHWAGCPANMGHICEIAQRHHLIVVEDACQALGAKIQDKHVGMFGQAAGFSVHPLKPLHVWGDGGVILTHSEAIAEKLRLIRNHGLESRDVVRCFGVNSRLDSLQAIVGNVVFESLDETIHARISHAKRYDRVLKGEPFGEFVEVPVRNDSLKHVFHLYIIKVKQRDELLEFLKNQGVEAKVHYPVPMHLQPAAAPWNYKRGRFPVAESLSAETITLPCHQYLKEPHIDYVIDKVAEFYGFKT